MCSMTGPCILPTPAFRLTEDFQGAIQEDPIYICGICEEFEFQKSIIKLKEWKYQTDIYDKSATGKSDWICKSCQNSMMKNAQKGKRWPARTKRTMCFSANRFEKIQTIIPRSFDEDHLKINPFHINTTIDDEWEDFSQHSDLV